MPWGIFERNNRFCVYKITPSGDPDDGALGCHDTRAEALDHLAALYASEAQRRMTSTVPVRLVADSDVPVVEGLGIPFGGLHNGRDLYNEFFSANTDLALDWYRERPLLYHHGLDDTLRTERIGRVTSYETRAEGVWVQAQLEKSHRFFEAIKQLINDSKLFFSSGAMEHLVQVNRRSGEILRWPWVELSLTPTPANLLATSRMAVPTTAIREGRELSARNVETLRRVRDQLRDAAGAIDELLVRSEWPSLHTRTRVLRLHELLI